MARKIYRITLSRPLYLFSIVCLLFASLNASADVFSEIEGLQPGEWYQIPNSNMSSVTPDWTSMPEPPENAGSNIRAIMLAWSGGAYDTKRQRFIVFGGGHTDYAGNELYVFSMHSYKWQRLTDPSTIFEDHTSNPMYNVPCQTCAPKHCDDHPGDPVVCGDISDPNVGMSPTLNLYRGLVKSVIDSRVYIRPASRHTYSGILYIPEPIDRFFSAGGSMWRRMESDGRPWFFDFENLQWDSETAMSYGWPACVTCPRISSPASVYDSVSGHIWIHKGGTAELWEFDPISYTWTQRSHFGGGIGPNYSSVFDSETRRMYLIGGEKTGTGHVYYYNLSDTGSNITLHELPTYGHTEIQTIFAPGVCYHASSKQVVAWAGTSKVSDGNNKWTPSTIGDKVYLLDVNPSSASYGRWTKLEPQGRSAGVPESNFEPPPDSSESRNNGTWGRWQYAPAKNLFIGVNSIDSNVYVYKLSSSPSFPDSKRPSSPENLRIQYPR